MHKGRGALVIAVALFVIASTIPFVSVDSDAVPAGVENDGVMLYEIGYRLLDGTSNFDGISVRNYSDQSISLSGYKIADESGKEFSLPDNMIAPGHVIAFVESISGGVWFCESTSMRSILTCDFGSFSLNNKGDNVYLKDPSGAVIDVVSYGNAKAPSSGWNGPAVDGSTADQAIKRVEPNDTDTRFDWTATSGEHTSNGFYDVPQFDGCIVEPFVFPDANGRPIFDAVMDATQSVHISIYMLTSDYMISLLAYLADKCDVEVKVLLENKPLGYDHPIEKLKVIEDAGGEVAFIGFNEPDRYSYVHNKYAVIDGDTVIVTSENWTGTNLSDAGNDGNRGWGAVITSSDYAAYMESYFYNDWKGDDVGTFDDKVSSVQNWSPKIKTQIDNYVNNLSYTKRSYDDVSLKMYMSPDNTFKALQYYMDSAEERIYTEQMDIGVDFYDLSNDTPLRWMKAAADRGVDARFLIKDSGAKDFVETLNTSTNIKASMMTPNGYSTMHNKGVIIDDCVWVSSVNWTLNAFLNNRECGLFFMDSDVTEFYLSEYMEDWDNDYTSGDTLTLTPVMPAHDGGPVSFTVNGVTGPCEWKVFTDDGEESMTTDGPTLTLDSSESLNYVLVKDSNDNTGRFIFKGAIVEDDGFDIPVKTVATATAGVGILGFIILLIRRFLKG